MKKEQVVNCIIQLREYGGSECISIRQWSIYIMRGNSSTTSYLLTIYSFQVLDNDDDSVQIRCI